MPEPSSIQAFESPAGPTLGEVLARTGADLLLLHHAPSQPIQTIVLCEPTRDQLVPAGAVVLAVGHAPGDPRFDALARQAGEAHASALIVKSAASENDALRRVGALYDISIVVAAPTVDWLALAALLKSACAVAVGHATGRQTDDLFAFANAVAIATGGATAIVDTTGQVLGFSNLADQPLDELRRRTTLHMEEIESPATDEEYERLYACEDCVELPGHDEVWGRVAAAVRSDGEILGSIWVLVPDPANTHVVKDALRPLLGAAAARLHHARLGMTMQQTRHALLLESLLRGGPDLAAAAGALELDRSQWFRLALLVTTQPPSPRLHRQIQGVTNWLRIAHRLAIAAEIDARQVVLFRGTSRDQWNAISASLERFFAGSQITRGSMSIAISLQVDEAQALPAEYERLQKLPYVAARSGQRPTLRMEDHWPSVELATIAAAYDGQDAGRLATLRRIQAFDHENNSEYWPTLCGFALANRNYALAAQRLHLHPNSVRYRIERLQELFALDIDDVNLFAWIVIQSHRQPQGQSATK